MNYAVIYELLDRIFIQVSDDNKIIDALIAAGASSYDAQELVRTYRNL